MGDWAKAIKHTVCQCIYMHYVYASKEGGQGHVENSLVGREAVMEGQER